MKEDKSTQFREVKDLMQVIDQPLPMFVPIAPPDANYYFYYPRRKITIIEYQSQPIPYFKTIKSNCNLPISV